MFTFDTFAFVFLCAHTEGRTRRKNGFQTFHHHLLLLLLCARKTRSILETTRFSILFASTKRSPLLSRPSSWSRSSSYLFIRSRRKSTRNSSRSDGRKTQTLWSARKRTTSTSIWGRRKIGRERIRRTETTRATTRTVGIMPMLAWTRKTRMEEQRMGIQSQRRSSRRRRSANSWRRKS